MIELLVVLVIVGVLLYVVHAVVPMDPKIRIIIDAVVILIVMIWILQGFGLIGPLPAFRRG